MPRLIVEREMPVARSTNPIPPCPNAIASLAAHTRRERSVNTGRTARNFRRNVVRFTLGTIASAPLQINQLFIHNPLATAPNQLWSWDITKLKGPTTWSWYHLYVILDVFSRYAVGWMIAPHESAALAEKLIGTCCAREGITRAQLTLHADRGSSMTSKPVALLLAELGVTKSHSRPHVSNDNPYSEAQFKTMKYRPDFPARFGSIEDARAHAVDFFRWYNTEHHHSALGLHTPYDVHHHLAAARHDARAQVLTAAYAVHPERFVRRPPSPRPLPTAAWINPPLPPVATDDAE